MNLWYISPSLQHFRCIKIIMSDTGSKHITDTFRHKHHAILVPVVTAADCILEATHRLTAAIEGIQEAAPDKLQPNKSARHVLLGKIIPQQPHPSPPTLLKDSNVDEEPIHMWDRTICAQLLYCPPMQCKGHLKLDVPSLMMMMHHLTLFPMYIGAALPSLTIGGVLIKLAKFFFA